MDLSFRKFFRYCIEWISFLSKSIKEMPFACLPDTLGDDHGGNYHTWLVKDHWLWGKKVLAQGWSTHEVFKGRQDFPLKWLSEAAIEVKFLTRKIGGGLEPMVVAIPQDR